jgi:Lysozyme like domain
MWWAIIAGIAAAVWILFMGQKITGIAGYAKQAGFAGQDLVTAVAIALAESSGDPNAKGDLTLGVSIGLWQINLRAHPEYSEQELYDPQLNANAAFKIYTAAHSTFRPWSTFTQNNPKTGEPYYAAHLSEAEMLVEA